MHRRGERPIQYLSASVNISGSKHWGSWAAPFPLLTPHFPCALPLWQMPRRPVGGRRYYDVRSSAGRLSRTQDRHETMLFAQKTPQAGLTGPPRA